YHVDAGPNGLPFIILMEDIVGAHCPDQVVGISADEADAIIGSVTPLHIQYWGSPKLGELGWLPPMNNEMYKGGQAMAEALLPAFIHHFRDRVEPETARVIADVCRRYTELLDHSVGIGTPTFTHTDCRAENYLFGGATGDDSITIVDFQLCTRHVGMWDVTNLLAGSLDPVTRRAHEHELIADYVGRITAAGIDYSLDQAMDEYRMCLLHQIAAQVITSDLSGGNERGRELLEQLHLRPVIAAQENNAGRMLATF
ncbi:MAG: oxidoreductase family protein, partial [Actinomycetota bacterium]